MKNHANTKILCFILSFTSTVAMGCQPLEPKFWEESAKRVKSNFDGAQFVVTADVIKLEKVSVQVSRESDFRTEVERGTFRVARAFKGKLKPGDTFNVDSGVSSCGRSILDDQWVPFIPGKRRPRNQPYPKRWLIYYTPPPVVQGPGPQLPSFEITSSPLSRPANWAKYDIDLLTTFAGVAKWD
jgi:hypothetical protein